MTRHTDAGCQEGLKANTRNGVVLSTMRGEDFSKSILKLHVNRY